MYIPLPVFWALFDQQGTGWTFQARRMDGDIGFYTILPDQMQVINPLLILIFIPLFQYVIYPALDKINLFKRPLQRLVVGGVLAAISFIVSAIIYIKLESQYPTLPHALNGHIRIYNNLPCDVTITARDFSDVPIIINNMDFYEKIDLEVKDNQNYDYSYTGTCTTGGSGKFKVVENESSGYYFISNQINAIEYFEDDNAKQEKGLPRIR